jgi:hypothetical protein
MTDRISIDRRVSELLEANNREVERRRAAVAALRRLRERFTGTVVYGQIPDAPSAAWVIDVDGKSVWLPDFIDAAIEAAEAPAAAPILSAASSG